MKKKILVYISVILVLLLSSFSASAVEENAAEEPVWDEIEPPAAEEAENGIAEEPVKKDEEQENANENSGTDTVTVSESITAFIEKNGDAILSTMTLLSSLLIAFLYKTGLLPLLRNGISAISDTAGKTGRMAEEFTERAAEELRSIRESTAPAADALKKTEEYLSALVETLKKAEAEQAETRDILSTETALFYELLSSVNLPQAQKDSMAESYYRLREKLEKSK